ncbi:MAG: alpha/beta hydrolase [Sciscionella sp.]
MSSTLVKLGHALVAGYVGLCAWGAHAARRTTYVPQAVQGFRREPDFTLTREGVAVRGWVAHGDRSDAVLYFHGNASRAEDRLDDTAPELPDQALYLPAYRGYGPSGGEPSERALVADALALYDEVAPSYRTVSVVGRSLGSAVAVQVAAARPVHRLVLVTPFDSAAGIAGELLPILPWRLLLRDPYESRRWAARVRCPILVVRGSDDRVITPARTAALVAALRVPPEEVVLVGRQHSDVQDDPAYFAAIRRFLGADGGDAAAG